MLKITKDKENWVIQVPDRDLYEYVPAIELTTDEMFTLRDLLTDWLEAHISMKKNETLTIGGTE
jgi:hypothetical protein